MHVATVAAMLVALAASAEVVIAVTPDEVSPAQVSVVRGTRVRWQAPASVLVSLSLEDHSGQHVTTRRAGSIAVTFLDTGPHPYVVRVGVGRSLRGEVNVQPGPAAVGPPCAPESSRSLCIEPLTP